MADRNCAICPTNFTQRIDPSTELLQPANKYQVRALALHLYATTPMLRFDDLSTHQALRDPSLSALPCSACRSSMSPATLERDAEGAAGASASAGI